MPVLECVPNLSCGRLAEAVEALKTAAASVEGAYLLDSSSDSDHNRTVLTLAGESAPLQAAVVAVAREAVGLVDLRDHKGVHPRLGALDVAPFVPLGDASMSDALLAARKTAAAIAFELSVPVFLYEQSARADHRRSLPQIRKGGLAALAERMKSADWIPDYGPQVPHPTAGVSIVGARDFLIAFNVILATEEIEVARSIAAAIREANGGLPGVRALGLPLAGRSATEVSTNLLDYRKTPPREVYSAICLEAAERGVEVTGGELIGLAPAAALEGVEGPEIGLERLPPEKVLENRLDAVGLAI